MASQHLFLCAPPATVSRHRKRSPAEDVHGRDIKISAAAPGRDIAAISPEFPIGDCGETELQQLTYHSPCPSSESRT